LRVAALDSAPSAVRTDERLDNVSSHRGFDAGAAMPSASRSASGRRAAAGASGCGWSGYRPPPSQSG
jgi:hypothetical protein